MLVTAKQLVKRALGRTEPPTMSAPDGVAGADWYDRAYKITPEYHIPYWESHYYFLWTILADRIRRAGLKRVLDIGCGPGQFAACLYGLAPIERYVGLDFSGTAIEMAKAHEPRGTFHQGDATTTTLGQDPSIDVVTCLEVLEHIPGDTAVIAQWRPGLHCLCTVPNFPWLSHVRHFTNADQVTERYAKYFDDFDVMGVQGHHSSKNVYWLMEGIRNEVRA